ncbi:hypothetical protein XENORESO_003575 [Xenotaenia resolanae]|uniref:Uncharacterized protein n=1 Tax=Xenotaenia resolanae TaxID=208358 RepID=A0ABV0X0M9_9TELE
MVISSYTTRVQMSSAWQASAASDTARSFPIRLSVVVRGWKDEVWYSLGLYLTSSDMSKTLDRCALMDVFLFFFQKKYIEIKFSLHDIYYKANQQNIFSNTYKENVLSKGVS